MEKMDWHSRYVKVVDTYGGELEIRTFDGKGGETQKEGKVLMNYKCEGVRCQLSISQRGFYMARGSAPHSIEFYESRGGVFSGMLELEFDEEEVDKIWRDISNSVWNENNPVLEDTSD